MFTVPMDRKAGLTRFRCDATLLGYLTEVPVLLLILGFSLHFLCSMMWHSLSLVQVVAHVACRSQPGLKSRHPMKFMTSSSFAVRLGVSSVVPLRQGQ